MWETQFLVVNRSMRRPILDVIGWRLLLRDRVMQKKALVTLALGKLGFPLVLLTTQTPKQRTTGRRIAETACLKERLQSQSGSE
jgi:hypothetical protein